MTLVISLILLTLYGVICAQSLRKGLLVFVASLPLYLVRLELAGIPTTLLELMLLVLAVTWALGFVEERRRDSLKRLSRQYKNLLIGVGLVLAGAILGLTQTQDIAGGLNIIKSYILEPVLLGVIIWSISRSSKAFKVRHMLLALCVPALTLSVIAIFQALTGLTIPATWALEGRVTSLYPYPNALSHFLAPIVTILAVLLTDGKSRLSRLQRNTYATTIVLGTAAIALAQTEAALLAIFVSIFLVSFFYRGGARITVPIVAALLVVAMVVPPIRTKVIQKATLSDWSGHTRVVQWNETSDFLTSGPLPFLLGAGPNGYPAAIAPFHTAEHLEIFQYPHNVFLNTWVEFGFLGLSGFVLIGGSIWLITKQSWNRFYVVPLSAGIAEMILHGMVDVPFLKNDLALLTSVIVALLVISAKREKAFETLTLFER